MNPTRRSLLLGPLVPLLPAAAPANTPQAAETALWAAEFQTLEGQALKLSTYRGQWLLINFWATWCAPCIKELPDFDQFHREEASKPAGKGWRVVGLAIDGPTPVRQFLQRRPVGFPIGLAGLNGGELMEKLGNLRKGALPFTVLANAAGQVVWRRPGETPLALLREQRKKFGP